MIQWVRNVRSDGGDFLDDIFGDNVIEKRESISEEFNGLLSDAAESIMLAFSRTGPPYDGVECPNSE